MSTAVCSSNGFPAQKIIQLQATGFTMGFFMILPKPFRGSS
jgi:hypothetical protein